MANNKLSTFNKKNYNSTDNALENLSKINQEIETLVENLKNAYTAIKQIDDISSNNDVLKVYNSNNVKKLTNKNISIDDIFKIDTEKLRNIAPDNQEFQNNVGNAINKLNTQIKELKNTKKLIENKLKTKIKNQNNNYKLPSEFDLITKSLDNFGSNDSNIEPTVLEQVKQIESNGDKFQRYSDEFISIFKEISGQDKKISKNQIEKVQATIKTLKEKLKNDVNDENFNNSAKILENLKSDNNIESSTNIKFFNKIKIASKKLELYLHRNENNFVDILDKAGYFNEVLQTSIEGLSTAEKEAEEKTKEALNGVNQSPSNNGSNTKTSDLSKLEQQANVLQNNIEKSGENAEITIENAGETIKQIKESAKELQESAKEQKLTFEEQIDKLFKNKDNKEITKYQGGYPKSQSFKEKIDKFFKEANIEKQLESELNLIRDDFTNAINELINGKKLSWFNEQVFGEKGIKNRLLSLNTKNTSIKQQIQQSVSGGGNNGIVPPTTIIPSQSPQSNNNQPTSLEDIIKNPEAPIKDRIDALRTFLFPQIDKNVNKAKLSEIAKKYNIPENDILKNLKDNLTAEMEQFMQNDELTSKLIAYWKQITTLEDMVHAFEKYINFGNKYTQHNINSIQSHTRSELNTIDKLQSMIVSRSTRSGVNIDEILKSLGLDKSYLTKEGILKQEDRDWLKINAIYNPENANLDAGKQITEDLQNMSDDIHNKFNAVSNILNAVNQAILKAQQEALDIKTENKTVKDIVDSGKLENDLNDMIFGTEYKGIKIDELKKYLTGISVLDINNFDNKYLSKIKSMNLNNDQIKSAIIGLKEGKLPNISDGKFTNGYMLFNGYNKIKTALDEAFKKYNEVIDSQNKQRNQANKRLEQIGKNAIKQLEQEEKADYKSKMDSFNKSFFHLFKPNTDLDMSMIRGGGLGKYKELSKAINWEGFFNMGNAKKFFLNAFGSFKSFLGSALRGVESAFRKVWSIIAKVSKSIVVSVTGAVASVTAAITGFVATFTMMGKSILTATDEYRRQTIAIAGVYQSASKTNQMINMTYGITKGMPIDYTKATQTLSELSAIPALQQILRSPDVSKAEQLLSKMFKVISAMTTMRPDQTSSDAIFSLRNAFAGDLRSLAKRFDLPVNNIMNAKGTMGLASVKSDPLMMLDSLEQYFDSFLDIETVNKISDTIGVIIEKIKGAFNLFKSNIGTSGFYDLVIKDFRKIRDYVTNLITSDEGKALAKRISDIFSNVYVSAQSIFVKIKDGFLNAFNIQAESFPDMFTKILETFAKTVKYIDSLIDGNKISDFIKDTKTKITEFVKTVKTYIEKVKPTINSIIDDIKKVVNFVTDEIKELLDIFDKYKLNKKGLLYIMLFGPGNSLNMLTSGLSVVANLLISSGIALGTLVLNATMLKTTLASLGVAFKPILATLGLAAVKFAGILGLLGYGAYATINNWNWVKEKGANFVDWFTKSGKELQDAYKQNQEKYNPRKQEFSWIMPNTESLFTNLWGNIFGKEEEQKNKQDNETEETTKILKDLSKYLEKLTGKLDKLTDSINEVTLETYNPDKQKDNYDKQIQTLTNRMNQIISTRDKDWNDLNISEKFDKMFEFENGNKYGLLGIDALEHEYAQTIVAFDNIIKNANMTLKEFPDDIDKNLLNQRSQEFSEALNKIPEQIRNTVLKSVDIIFDEFSTKDFKYISNDIPAYVKSKTRTMEKELYSEILTDLQLQYSFYFATNDNFNKFIDKNIKKYYNDRNAMVRAMYNGEVDMSELNDVEKEIADEMVKRYNAEHAYYENITKQRMYIETMNNSISKMSLFKLSANWEEYMNSPFKKVRDAAGNRYNDILNEGSEFESIENAIRKTRDIAINSFTTLQEAYIEATRNTVNTVNSIFKEGLTKLVTEGGTVKNMFKEAKKTLYGNILGVHTGQIANELTKFLFGTVQKDEKQSRDDIISSIDMDIKTADNNIVNKLDDFMFQSNKRVDDIINAIYNTNSKYFAEVLSTNGGNVQSTIEQINNSKAKEIFNGEKYTSNGWKVTGYKGLDNTFKHAIPNHKKDTAIKNINPELAQYETVIQHAAKTYDLDPLLIKSIMLTESNADYENSKKPNKAKAQGLMQVTPQALQEVERVYGIKYELGDHLGKEKNVYNNIMAGSAYLKWLLKAFNNDYTLATTAYNAGIGKVKNAGGLTDKLNDWQNQQYAWVVKAFYDRFENEANKNGTLKNNSMIASFSEQSDEAKKISEMLAKNSTLIAKNMSTSGTCAKGVRADFESIVDNRAYKKFITDFEQSKNKNNYFGAWNNFNGRKEFGLTNTTTHAYQYFKDIAKSPNFETIRLNVDNLEFEDIEKLIKPGDVVTYGEYGPSKQHIGIYAGNGILNSDHEEFNWDWFTTRKKRGYGDIQISRFKGFEQETGDSLDDIIQDVKRSIDISRQNIKKQINEQIQQIEKQQSQFDDVMKNIPVEIVYSDKKSLYSSLKEQLSSIYEDTSNKFNNTLDDFINFKNNEILEAEDEILKLFHKSSGNNIAAVDLNNLLDKLQLSKNIENHDIVNKLYTSWYNILNDAFSNMYEDTSNKFNNTLDSFIDFKNRKEAKAEFDTYKNLDFSLTDNIIKKFIPTDIEKYENYLKSNNGHLKKISSYAKNLVQKEKESIIRYQNNKKKYFEPLEPNLETSGKLFKPFNIEFNQDSHDIEKFEITELGKDSIGSAISLASGINNLGSIVSNPLSLMNADSFKHIPTPLKGIFKDWFGTVENVENKFKGASIGSYFGNMMAGKGGWDSLLSKNVLGGDAFNLIQGENKLSQRLTGVTSLLFGRNAAKKLATKLTGTKLLGTTLSKALPVIGSVVGVLSQKGWLGGAKDRTAEGRARYDEYNAYRNALVKKRYDTASQYYMSDLSDLILDYQFGGINAWTQKRGKWYKGTKRKVMNTDATDFVESMKDYWDLMLEAAKDQLNKQRALNKLQSINQEEYIKKSYEYAGKQLDMQRNELSDWKGLLDNFKGKNATYTYTDSEGFSYTFQDVNDEIEKLTNSIAESEDKFNDLAEQMDEYRKAFAGVYDDYILKAMYGDSDVARNQMSIDQIHREYDRFMSEGGEAGSKEWIEYQIRLIDAQRDLTNAIKQLHSDYTNQMHNVVSSTHIKNLSAEKLKDASNYASAIENIKGMTFNKNAYKTINTASGSYFTKSGITNANAAYRNQLQNILNQAGLKNISVDDYLQATETGIQLFKQSSPISVVGGKDQSLQNALTSKGYGELIGQINQNPKENRLGELSSTLIKTVNTASLTGNVRYLTSSQYNALKNNYVENQVNEALSGIDYRNGIVRLSGSQNSVITNWLLNNATDTRGRKLTTNWDGRLSTDNIKFNYDSLKSYLQSYYGNQFSISSSALSNDYINALGQGTNKATTFVNSRFDYTGKQNQKVNSTTLGALLESYGYKGELTDAQYNEALTRVLGNLKGGAYTSTSTDFNQYARETMQIWDNVIVAEKDGLGQLVGLTAEKLEELIEEIQYAISRQNDEYDYAITELKTNLNNQLEASFGSLKSNRTTSVLEPLTDYVQGLAALFTYINEDTNLTTKEDKQEFLYKDAKGYLEQIGNYLENYSSGIRNMFDTGLFSMANLEDALFLSDGKNLIESFYEQTKTIKNEILTSAEKGKKANISNAIDDLQNNFVKSIESWYDYAADIMNKDTMRNTVLSSISGFDDFKIANSAREMFNNAITGLSYGKQNTIESLMGIGNGEFGTDRLSAMLGISSADLQRQDPYELYYEYEKSKILNRIENAEEESDEAMQAYADLWNIMKENAEYLKRKADETTESIEKMLDRIEETARTRVSEEAKTQKGDIIFFDLGSARDMNGTIRSMIDRIKTNDPDAQKLVNELKTKLLNLRK